MILHIVSEDNQNLFDCVLNNHLHNKYIGKYDLQKFLKQSLNGVDDISHIFIDIKTCKNSLVDIANIINSYSMIHRNIKFIIYLGNGIENKKFILELISIDIFNIITAKSFDKAREELQMCLDGLMTESYINELLGISLIKANKIEFRNKEMQIAIVGSMPRVGTTTVAINLSSFIASCNGKTLYIDMQGDTLKYIAKDYDLKGDSDLYKYSNILHLQEHGITNTNKYNCIVYDFGVISNSLASSLKEFDLVVFVTTGKSFEKDATQKAIDILNNNQIAFATITNLSKKDGDISFVENLFDGEYRFDSYKKLFIGGKNEIRE